MSPGDKDFRKSLIYIPRMKLGSLTLTFVKLQQWRAFHYILLKSKRRIMLKCIGGSLRNHIKLTWSNLLKIIYRENIYNSPIGDHVPLAIAKALLINLIIIEAMKNSWHPRAISASQGITNAQVYIYIWREHYDGIVLPIVSMMYDCMIMMMSTNTVAKMIQKLL